MTSWLMAKLDMFFDNKPCLRNTASEPPESKSYKRNSQIRPDVLDRWTNLI